MDKQQLVNRMEVLAVEMENLQSEGISGYVSTKLFKAWEHIRLAKLSLQTDIRFNK